MKNIMTHIHVAAAIGGSETVTSFDEVRQTHTADVDSRVSFEEVQCWLTVTTSYKEEALAY